MIKLVILTLALIVPSLLACNGKVNPYEVVNSSFYKVAIHQHGEKYAYHNQDLNQSYYLLKLRGDSYQAGLAYGTLMKNEIK